jgi:dTDP-4-dehydrorhamnose reductase
MRILLIGKNGQLGWELQRCLSPLGELQALDYPQIDLAEPESLREVIRAARPEVIVNAAAYTAVDQAESERELAFAINAASPGVMAEEAKRTGALLIHYSTDYVFDGTKGAPYVESDQPNPLNVYGQSKLAGEQAIQAVDGAYLILRTAWVYSLRRDSFVTKVLKWARTQETLRVVDDQVSSPTWARMLAECTGLVLARGYEYIEERKGLYHLAGSGYASRLEWAKAIIKLDPKKHEYVLREIQPAQTSDFPTPAVRPLFSALNCGKFEDNFSLQVPDWERMLALAIK